MKKITSTFILAALAMSFACTSGNQTAPEIDQAALEAVEVESYATHIRTLSSDEFMGRKPFTKGDTLTVAYIEEQFKNLGLEPGNGNSYFQEVPMAEITSNPGNPAWTFKGENGQFTIQYLDDYVIGSKRLVEEIKVDETELVFAGFGIVAPEYDWNDYEGLDAAGKTVVVMVNDPGYYDKTLFKGDTMTYYGRWTYKFEEAARQGAAGVLIIHDTGGASYGWNVVRSGWAGPQLNLQTSDNGASRAAFEGWLTTESADKLFKLAGNELDLIAEAKKPGFKPVALGVKTAVTINNSFRKSTSNNVIAKLPGTKRSDEVIIYTAHWDHLGIGEAVEGDSIFNGAIDNATGVAALFELAKGFKAASVQPERSIVFLAVTAEEEGLLGSAYYASNPIYPLNKTVANINMDSFSPLGRTSDYSVV
ncbi:MAG TPA: M28 family metallopeptidase, partial [Sphingobacteriaceae bacterium]|nr:M28 family metallopeptidase [Sphingobacteriaceae bacterium]